MIRIADLVEDYLVLIRRNEHITNAEIAKQFGLKPRSLGRQLARARAAGLLDVRRIGYAGRVEIARHGETNGVPVRTGRRRRGAQR